MPAGMGGTRPGQLQPIIDNPLARPRERNSRPFLELRKKIISLTRFDFFFALDRARIGPLPSRE